MKFYKAILHTGGKTAEQIRDRNREWNFSDIEIDNILKFYSLFDGLKVVVVHDSKNEDATLISWSEADGARVKEAIYTLEQDPFMGTYINQREEFDHDWDLGCYSMDGAIVFQKAEFGLLDEICNSSIDQEATE